MENKIIKTNTLYKESLSLCTPVGSSCFKSIKVEEGKCLTPCKGVFADVQKNTIEFDLNTIDDYQTILDNYTDYKSGYSQEYSAEVGGMKFLLMINTLMINTCSNT